MLVRCLILWSACLLIAAAGPEDGVKKELKLFEGKW